jgi:hypothetical protein
MRGVREDSGVECARFLLRGRRAERGGQAGLRGQEGGWAAREVFLAGRNKHCRLIAGVRADLLERAEECC